MSDGFRGPVPQRSDQRRRENAPEVPIVNAAASTNVEVPDPDEDWHPIATRWYRALGRSGQRVWFEPSDWAEAYFLAEVMSRALIADRINGQLLAALQTGSTRLLSTEADRRRLRIELVRGKATDPDEDAAVADLDAYRSRISG